MYRCQEFGSQGGEKLKVLNVFSVSLSKSQGQVLFNVGF